MENEFVSYELALELKELDFDFPVLAEYRQWDGIIPYLKLYQDLDDCSTDERDYTYTTECTAPLWQQVFDWFREKHNIHGFVTLSENNKHYMACIIDKKYQYDFDMNGYDTYQKAQISCIEKLIEIIKTNEF